MADSFHRLQEAQADGTVFYVMPFVQGESLRNRLTREVQLPVADAVRIAVEVAGALEYAHRHGVIHRDIKPDNVLLHDGRPLVADFGIALAWSHRDGLTRITKSGVSLGTPHYMSPEQAAGEQNLDPRADTYALGVVLYEMLAGQPPFTGLTAQAIFARVLAEEPRPLVFHRKTVPPHVDAAVARALEKLPADRWETAAEFAAGLTSTGASSRGRRPLAGAVRRFAIPGSAAAFLIAAAWIGLHNRPGALPSAAP